MPAGLAVTGAGVLGIGTGARLGLPPTVGDGAPVAGAGFSGIGSTSPRSKAVGLYVSPSQAAVGL